MKLAYYRPMHQVRMTLKKNHVTLYTAYAGWTITAVIAVKFGPAHGRSILEDGSTKRLDGYRSRGVTRPSVVIVNT